MLPGQDSSQYRLWHLPYFSFRVSAQDNRNTEDCSQFLGTAPLASDSEHIIFHYRPEADFSHSTELSD
jgi:hypothetical protein